MVVRKLPSSAPAAPVAPTPERVVTVDDVAAAFSAHWGGREFRPFQRAVVAAALAGQDTLAVFAVGNGKSACFQAPALVLPGTVLVVSPLIALMKDQVDGSRERGIKADCIHSNMDEKEIEDVMARCLRGDVKLLYVAPERLWSPTFNRMLRTLKCPLLACDEAHTVSRFSSFRPAYLRIKEAVRFMRSRPVIMALTATMTSHIEGEVVSALGMRPSYARLVGDPIRDNLDYRAVWASGRKGAEWGVLDDNIHLLHRPGRHIIYSGSRKGSEMIMDKLVADHDFPAERIGFYHAGMEKDDRRRVQDEFAKGKLTVIVATVAFGMGIDIPDIRTVINFGIPGSMEDAVQMGGRAGRDGQRSIWLCIGSDYSKSLQERFISGAHPPWYVYNDVHRWLVENLKDEDVLYKSAKSILYAMTQSGMKAEGASYGESEVGAVLHRFEAYGVVLRRPTSSAYDVELTSRVIDAPLGGFISDVRGALLTLCGRPYPGGTTKGMVERGDVARNSHVAEGKIAIALEKMKQGGLIKYSRSYNGKTTKWNPGMREKPLSEIVDRDEIEARRDVELERLDHVVNYVSSSRPQEYIREYFAKPTPTGG